MSYIHIYLYIYIYIFIYINIYIIYIYLYMYIYLYKYVYNIYIIYINIYLYIYISQILIKLFLLLWHNKCKNNLEWFKKVNRSCYIYISAKDILLALSTFSNCHLIFLFPFLNRLSYSGSLDQIPADIGRRRVHPDRSPVHLGARVETDGSFRVQLTCVSLDWGRKPTLTPGEHANSFLL